MHSETVPIPDDAPELLALHPLADPFVGREAELATIQDSIAAASDGIGSILIVDGEAGIGKTRLAQEGASLATSCGLKVLWGRCWEGAGAPAFWPWVQVFRAYASEIAAISNTTGIRLSRISASIPELGDIVPSGQRECGSPAEHSRFEFFDAATQLLHHLGTRTPAMIVLDDLHCADDGSLQLLKLLAPMLSTVPLLIVAAYRDDESSLIPGRHSTFAELANDRSTKRLSLGGLQRSDVARYLSPLSPDNAFAEAIFSRTNGNPLFLREITTILRRSRTLHDATPAFAATLLPLSIRDAILRRLHPLPPASLIALSTASVLGREFDLLILSTLLEDEPAVVSDLLSPALLMKFIDRQDDVHFRFTHVMVQDSLYDMLPLSRKTDLHAAAVHAIEASRTISYATKLSLLAHHHTAALALGRDPLPAVSALVAAAHDCTARHAHEESANFFQRALDVAGDRISPQDRGETLLALGQALTLAGRYPEARDILDTAAQQVRLLDDPLLFARIAIAFRGVAAGTIPPDHTALRLLREALRRLGTPLSSTRTIVQCALSEAMHFAGAPDEMRAHAASALDAAREIGDPPLLGLALSAQIPCHLEPTHITDALRYSTQLLTIANDLSDTDLEFRGYLGLRAARLLLGDVEGSLDALRQLETLAALTRHPRHRWYSSLLSVAASTVAARFDEADQLCTAALELGRGLHHSSPELFCMMQRFELARSRHDFGDWLSRYHTPDPTHADLHPYQAGLALILCWSGQIDQGLEIVAGLASDDFNSIPLDSCYLWTISMLAECCADHAAESWREQLYRKLEVFSGLGIAVSWGLVFDGAVDHYLGSLAASLGQWDRAAHHFQQALRMGLRFRAPSLVARTRFRLARLFSDRRAPGDAAHAHRLYNQAITAFNRLGLPYYANRVNESKTRIAHPPGSGHDSSCNWPSQLREPLHENSHPNVFRRDGEFWTVRYSDLEVRLADCRGMQYIAALLIRPDEDQHVLDLAATVRGLSPQEQPRDGVGTTALCDEQARASYRRRLASMDEELQDAQDNNDIGRIDLIQRERDQLVKELSRTYGLGGRKRQSGSAAERARVNVRNNISNALKVIKRYHFQFWRHLSSSLRTGVYCSYRPEGRTDWNVRTPLPLFPTPHNPASQP